MANTDTLKTKLTNIANAIRSKSKKTDSLSLDNMVSEINSLGVMNWIEGGVAFNISVTSGSTVRVRRHGNAVIVYLVFTLAQDIANGTEILTFNNGWKSNETSLVTIIRQLPRATDDAMSAIFVDIKANDGSIYSRDDMDAYDTLLMSFGFEATPLT